MHRRIARPVRISAALIISTLVIASIVPLVSADDGLEVNTPYPAVAVAPGTTVSFDLTVTSTRAATVALEVGGVPDGWDASLLGGGFVVDGLSVTPDVDGTVRLDVDVPADAVTGTDAIVEELTVTATGEGARDVLPITIRVNAEAAGEITLTTSTPALTGSSDASFSFDLQFQNGTAQDVTVSVAATGPADWDVAASLTGENQAASTVVEAGASQNVTVTATAPANAVAQVYPLQVEARAGDRTISSDLAIEITGSYSMTLDTPNEVLSASGSAGSPTTQAFVITNTGTAPITGVKVTDAAPTNWTVTYAPSEGIATIAPGATAEITATITPSSEAVAGDYRVSFTASATEGGADATAAVRVTVETSPLWALIGLGIIVLIVGGLFYVFRTYGRR